MVVGEAVGGVSGVGGASIAGQTELGGSRKPI